MGPAPYSYLTKMAFLLQQSHLGPNSDKALTLVDAAILRAEAISSNPRRWTPTGEAFIFRLSNELLVSIVDYATAKKDTQCSCSKQELARDKTTVKGLNLVCQRIKAIAQPLLYRKIKFDWPTCTSWIVASSLPHANLPAWQVPQMPTRRTSLC